MGNSMLGPSAERARYIINGLLRDRGSHVVAELAPAADVYKDPLYGIQMVGGSPRQRI
jgi:hypothetical protein